MEEIDSSAASAWLKTVPTHTWHDSCWHQAVTICVITFSNQNGVLNIDRGRDFGAKTHVFMHDDSKGSLTMSLAASFSGVWGGSVVAGLLDGMAESSSVKQSTDSGKWSKSKHGKGPQVHRGAASFTVSDAVGHSVLAGSVHPPFSVQIRQKTHSRSRVNFRWGQMWPPEETQSDRFKCNWSMWGKNNTNKV